MSEADDTRATPYERLVDAATRLFYARGVANVGINEIIARAQVARMTLYHHFTGKDALVQAVLERRAEELRSWLFSADERAETPEGQLLAVFDLLREWAEAPDFRGCPFINATIELGGQLNSAQGIARDYKETTRNFLRERAERARLSDEESLSQQLLALIDGATVDALITGRAEPVWHAKRAAQTLIEAARTGTPTRHPNTAQDAEDEGDEDSGRSGSSSRSHFPDGGR